MGYQQRQRDLQDMNDANMTINELLDTTGGGKNRHEISKQKPRAQGRVAGLDAG